MKYRDMIGYGKKKKIIKKSKVKEVTVLDNLKEELNEWSEKPTGPKRWFKPMDEDGLTEFEKSQMNEGPAYEYAPYMKKIEKAENMQAKEVNNLVKVLEKKGLEEQANQVGFWYVTGVNGGIKSFMNLFERMLRKLQ